MRMEPVKFFVAGCACVFGACMAINYARAQQFVYPVPPPPPPGATTLTVTSSSMVPP